MIKKIKKIKMIKKILLLAMFGSSILVNGFALDLPDYLIYVNEQFNNSNSEYDKQNIISQPINIQYVKNLKSLQDLDSVKLKNTTAFNKSNAIAIAVAVGDITLVRKFLSVIDNVNDVSLLTSGYRQFFSLAHVVLLPELTYKANINDLYIKNLLNIIDELGRAGINFNFIPQGGTYQNPPLAMGSAWSHSTFSYEQTTMLEARAMLYGANPRLKGSSFNGVNLDKMDEIYDLIKAYYFELVKDSNHPLNIKFHYCILGNAKIQYLNDIYPKLDNLMKRKSVILTQLSDTLDSYSCKKTVAAKTRNKQKDIKATSLKNDLQYLSQQIIQLNV